MKRARGGLVVYALAAAVGGCSLSSEGTGEAQAGAGGQGAADGGLGAAAGSSGSGGSASADAGVPDPYALEFVSPAPNQVFTQAGSPPLASIGFQVLAGPGIARVRYEIENDFVLGESNAGPGFALSYDYQYAGSRWARAVGFDAASAQVAEALVDFRIEPPPGASCLETLDALGVAYTNTVAKGVVDAVKLSGPINGVLYAKTDTDQPSGDPMACEFVLTLHKFADVLKAHGFVKIGGLGSYCYRCCCAWSQENYCRGPEDPEPDCSQPPYSGFSNHSWGRALDMRWLYKQTGEVYDVNNPDHFVKWPSSSETCTTALAAQTGISKELYSLVCDAAAQQVFEIVLTPNYNAAHRNHFHADIGQSGVPGSHKVLSSQPGAVDVGEFGDE